MLFYNYLITSLEGHDGQIPYLASRTQQTLNKTCYLNADLTALTSYADAESWYSDNKIDNENTWLAVRASGVLFTDNIGASWSDKTGTLPDFIDVVSLNAIKFVP